MKPKSCKLKDTKQHPVHGLMEGFTGRLIPSVSVIPDGQPGPWGQHQMLAIYWPDLVWLVMYIFVYFDHLNEDQSQKGYV